MYAPCGFVLERGCLRWMAAPASPAHHSGRVEGALSQLFATAIQVRSAGRTDAGVHALHQVCFSAPVQRSVEQMRIRAASKTFSAYR